MSDISRRKFLGLAGAAAVGAAFAGFPNLKPAAAQAPVVGSASVTAPATTASHARVYFTKHLDAEHFIKLYSLVNEGIYGKVGLKLHTGEKNGPNILPTAWVKQLQALIPDSSIVETNTYYKWDRYTTEEHRATLQTNGWNFCPVDILDEDGTVMLPVRGGKHFKEMSMGSHLTNYDSLMVLTHFKGHTAGGFGGSNKNIGIGCADGRTGKAMIHTGDNPDEWGLTPQQWQIMKEAFMERMTESSKATVDYFGKHIAYINVMRRMSVDCDCAGINAAEPTIPDIGMLASTDILAIDQACVDLVYASPNNKDLVERIESRRGLRQLSYMAELKMGNPRYELICVD